MLKRLVSRQLCPVATYRLPDGAPIVPGVNARCDSPVRPGDFTALRTINGHDQATEDRLVDLQQLLCCYHIVQLRDTMRSQVSEVQRVCVSSFDNGSSSELRNGNMVWVPIATVWSEGHYNVWLDTAEMSNELCDHFGWMALIQVAIDVIQKIDADSKHSGSCE